MSFFSKVNPTPTLPPYSGPYSVGTIDVEVPAADLEEHQGAPDSDLTTVSFRVFYPCTPNEHARPVRWIPTPQRAYLAAYARFLGANPAFATVVSYFPQLFYYATIPAHRNAKLCTAPTSSGKWPTMVFSHGLGGSRNAYSHILGSVASHGVVVIAPDHRDGSAPISFIRTTEDIRKAKSVTYKRISHEPTPDVYAARDKQLRIRMWELSLIHEVLLRIEEGKAVRNLNPNSLSVRKQDYNEVLAMFRGRLDVIDPGRITWAGHSFGACTVYQLIKSVYWHSSYPTYSASSRPLLIRAPSERLLRQIAPSTPMMLLDMWCLPLRSPETEWLWEKPLPCFDKGGPGGKALLSISSESFFNWNGNLSDTKRALSQKPAADSYTDSMSPARMFYVEPSAHHSQSDFGNFFPWITKKFFKIDEPERISRLNVRAMLEVLRANNYEISDTSYADMEMQEPSEASSEEKPRRDLKILDSRPRIRGWIPINRELGKRGNDNVVTDKKSGPAEGVVEGEAMGGAAPRDDVSM